MPVCGQELSVGGYVPGERVWHALCVYEGSLVVVCGLECAQVFSSLARGLFVLELGRL